MRLDTGYFTTNSAFVAPLYKLRPSTAQQSFSAQYFHRHAHPIYSKPINAKLTQHLSNADSSFLSTLKLGMDTSLRLRHLKIGLLSTERTDDIELLNFDSENQKQDNASEEDDLEKEILLKDQKTATISSLNDIDDLSSSEFHVSSSHAENSKKISTEAIILLNLVAVIWGTQHAVIKMVVDDSDVSAFTFARFALGALIASPYTPSLRPIFSWLSSDESIKTNHNTNVDTNIEGIDEDIHDEIELANSVTALDENTEHSSTLARKESDEESDSILAWRWGLEMGLWMFLGYAFQAIGLSYTTASRSGFLLYLNVKFVPFFARILLGRQISIPTWASAFTALLGTALLSYDGTSASLNVGDLWSVAAAAASAMFILRLESASAAVKSSTALNSASLWVVALAALLWSIGGGALDGGIFNPDPSQLSSVGSILLSASESTISKVIQTVTSHPGELVYLGGVTTALANYIQTRAQKSVTPERASVFYAMDPVYGAIFAYGLLGEELSLYGLIGAGFITAAAATNAFLDFGQRGNNNDILICKDD